MKKLVRGVNECFTISWEEAVEGFLFWKQAQGISDTTLDDYESHTNRFFKRFPNSWHPDNLRSSILEYMADKIKPATYNLRRVYLGAFFQWCVDEGNIPDNPLKGFKKRKAPGRVVDVPQDTLQKLLSLPDKHSFAGLRDFALIMLTLDTGIRPSEALNLLEKDFDLKHLLITVPAEVAKTRTERVLPILPPVADAIRKIIKVRHPGWGNDIPVFCSELGTTLNRCTWGDRLEVYSEKLGYKVRPYDLRHAFSLMYLRNGGNAFGLQKTLGHLDLQMTRKYVNLTNTDLVESHQTASPINSLIKNEKKSKSRVRKI